MIQIYGCYQPDLEDVMKKDDNSKHIDLDLDALSDVPDTPKPTGTLAVKGLSVGELSELSKKDPATLTPVQSQQLEEASERMREALKAFEPIAPQLKEAMNVGQQAAREAQKILGNFKMPDIAALIEPPMMHGLMSESIKMPAIIPPASSVEQQKQTFLLERMVGAFEAQNAERDADLHQAIRPTYDSKNHLLIFANTPIPIPEDSDQEELCKALFRGGKPVKNPLQIGDVLMKMNVPIERIRGSKKVHSAKQALNDRVEKATQIKELFVIDSKKVWFNQKYL
jgi:hypothetical protein